MRPLVIYHANCADGFTAAWVAHRWLKSLDPELVAARHGEPAPDCKDREVYVLDFSYDLDTMTRIHNEAKALVLLDHHKSAMENLRSLAEIANKQIGRHVHFDMNKSGARLAWEYFYPALRVPTLVLVVEDRDLWRFQYPHTRAAMAAIFSNAYDLNTWNQLADILETHLDKIVMQGQAIERKHFKDIEELLKVCVRDMEIGGHIVPVANVPYTLGSDAANILSKDKPFAGYYWDGPEKRTFGLRSQPGTVDVSKIAQRYGGGGHENASGFSLTFEEAERLEVLRIDKHV